MLVSSFFRWMLWGLGLFSNGTISQSYQRHRLLHCSFASHCAVVIWDGSSGPAIISTFQAARKRRGMVSRSCLQSVLQNLSQLARGCLPGNEVCWRDLLLRKERNSSYQEINDTLCISFHFKSKKLLFSLFMYFFCVCGVWKDFLVPSWKYCWHNYSLRHSSWARWQNI